MTATITVEQQTTAGPHTVATLTTGQTLIARTVGDRWTGAMVEVADFNPTTLAIGAMVTLRPGTSHRLAIAAAITKLAA